MQQRLDEHSIHAYVTVVRAILHFEPFRRRAEYASKGNPHFIPLHKAMIVFLFCSILHYYYYYSVVYTTHTHTHTFAHTHTRLHTHIYSGVNVYIHKDMYNLVLVCYPICVPMYSHRCSLFLRQPQFYLGESTKH